MPQEAIFDIRRLQEITEGNPDIERELAGLYMKTVEQCLDRLHALSVSDEKHEWSSVMHELKGASLNIRASQMGAACREYMESRWRRRRGNMPATG